MTKEEWLQVRDQETIPYEVWFDYYREKGGYVDNIQSFISIFTNLMENAINIKCKEGMKRITPETAFEKMSLYYDEKFQIVE